MTNKIELTKDHRYIIDSKNEVPPVTKIIKETIGVGWEADQWYLDRGTAVHACAKLIAEGKKFKNDPQIDGYVEGIYRFFREVKFEVKYAELPVYSDLYKFAGTIDLVAKISGYNYLIDYKNSIDMERLGFQLGAYSQALSETKKIRIDLGAGIELDGKGSYKIYQIHPGKMRVYEKEFLALRTTYAIKERLNLITKE